MDANRRQLFQQGLALWEQQGGESNWAITENLWLAIEQKISSKGMRTLETGSGLSTWLLSESGCNHTALEHHTDWSQRILNFIDRQSQDEPSTKIVHCEITGAPAWYDWSPDGPYDLILIDGPPWYIGRDGVLEHLDQLVSDSTVLFIDDVNRPKDRNVADKIAAQLQRSIKIDSTGERHFAVIDSQ